MRILLLLGIVLATLGCQSSKQLAQTSTDKPRFIGGRGGNGGPGGAGNGQKGKDGKGGVHINLKKE